MGVDHVDKKSLTPSQSFEYRGQRFRIDLVGLVSLPTPESQPPELVVEGEDQLP